MTFVVKINPYQSRDKTALKNSDVFSPSAIFPTWNPKASPILTSHSILVSTKTKYFNVKESI